MTDSAPKATVRLSFGDPATVQDVRIPIQRDISAIVLDGDTMFVACDEALGVDRLLRDGDGFGRHRHIPLGDLVALPDPEKGEMDIEGLAIDGGWLWVAGSQSLKRDKAREGRGAERTLDDLADVDWDPNRQFIGRFPLVGRDGGLWPVAADGNRRAAHLRLGGKGRLRRWLGKDRHLAPFLMLPSKDNGLDVEGIVARGDRAWLGLRGPVLGEAACVLELEFRTTAKGHLKARRIDGRARYRKHFVDTDGQGVRDMKWDGDDLLLVTGPVMSGDGPAAVLRLRGFARRTDSGHVGEAGQELVQELPYRGAVDHPEGLVRWKGGDWLVVYDSPAPDRVSDHPPWVEGDVWALS